MKWFVEIVEAFDDGTEQVVKTLGPYTSEHHAEKADDGANRNMNHERFFTRTRTEP